LLYNIFIDNVLILTFGLFLNDVMYWKPCNLKGVVSCAILRSSVMNNWFWKIL
jgi:hypothetical protein